MIKVKIGEDERPGEPLDETWAHEQINRRRDAGESVCVRVSIEQIEADIVLSTVGCTHTGHQPIINPRPLERKIIELWEERGLNTNNFTSQDLVMFIVQLQDLL